MNRLLLASFAASAILLGCKREAPDAKAKVPIALPATRPAAGELVVVATLQAYAGTFPANDLYKYVFVMKYTVDSVVEGSFAPKEILVGHYDPRTPRNAIADDQKGKVGGDVDGFHAGDRHYLVLRPMDSSWTGAVEDEFYQDKSPRWFAAWASKI